MTMTSPRRTVPKSRTWSYTSSVARFQLRKGQHANARKLKLVLVMVAAQVMVLVASSLIEPDRLLQLVF